MSAANGPGQDGNSAPVGRPLFSGSAGLDNGPDSSGARRLVVLLILASVLLVLYLAQEVLIPLALATLLSFLLAIPAAWLERRGLNRVWAVVLVVGMALSVVAGIGYVVTSQVIQLAGDLPKYKENLRAKARVFAPRADGKLNELQNTLNELSDEMSGSTTTTVAAVSTNGGSSTTVVATTAEKGGAVSEGTSQGHSGRATSRPGNFNGSAANTGRSGTDSPSAATSQATGLGGSSPGAADSTAAPPPIPVRVVEGQTSALAVIRGWLGPVLAQLATVGIVLVFLLFMLIERESLRDRIVRLAGQRQITVTTRALDEAGDRVSRYMLMTCVVNVTYGIPVSVGLYFIGIPNALLWGLMCIVLRFIPYVGPWIGAAFPITIAIAVSNGWLPVMLTIGLFIILELISNNIVEPMLYGHSTGLSPFAVIVSAVFWTWMWGGVGLFMATPLTVCLLVLSRYVPQLRFLDVLLGDAPVLTPGERLYQRLMARDLDDAIDLAEEERKERTLVQLYDEVFMPALALAERDRTRGVLSGSRWHFALSSLSEMADQLANEPDPVAPEKKESRLRKFLGGDSADQRAQAAREDSVGVESELEMPYHGGGPGAGLPSPPVVATRFGTKQTASAARVSAASGSASVLPADHVAAMPGVTSEQTVPAGPMGTPGLRPAQPPTGRRVMILPARDEADELAGQMLSHVLKREGACPMLLPAATIGLEMMETTVRENPDAIVVSAMPPMAVGSARLLANRIRTVLPDARIIVGLWRAEGNMERCLERLASSKPDALLTTLADALVQVAPPAPPPAPPPEMTPAAPTAAGTAASEALASASAE